MSYLFAGTKHSNIKRHSSIPRGQHITLTSTLDIPTNVGNTRPPIFACGWADQTLKNFIGTSGHTLLGAPHERTTYKIIVADDGSRTQSKRTTLTARPQCLVDMFTYFSGIDVHDHLRQGVFNLEESWRTYQWKTRAFTTLTAMSMTDAYLSWCHELPHNRQAPGFADFLGRLAHQLVHNPWRAAQLPSQVATRTSLMSPPPAALLSQDQHQLSHLKHLPGNAGRADVRLRCSVCGTATSYYCKQCSAVGRRTYSATGIIALCKPGERCKRTQDADTGELVSPVVTNKLCYKKHLDESNF